MCSLSLSLSGHLYVKKWPTANRGGTGCLRSVFSRSLEKSFCCSCFPLQNQSPEPCVGSCSFGVGCVSSYGGWVPTGSRINFKEVPCPNTIFRGMQLSQKFTAPAGIAQRRSRLRQELLQGAERPRAVRSE